MKAKLKGDHPNNYIKVQIKPGLFVSINKRFQTVPKEYFNVLYQNEWVEIEGAPVTKKPVAKSYATAASKPKPNKKKSLFGSKE